MYMYMDEVRFLTCQKKKSPDDVDLRVKKGKGASTPRYPLHSPPHPQPLPRSVLKFWWTYTYACPLPDRNPKKKKHRSNPCHLALSPSIVPTSQSQKIDPRLEQSGLLSTQPRTHTLWPLYLSFSTRNCSIACCNIIPIGPMIPVSRPHLHAQRILITV